MYVNLTPFLGINLISKTKFDEQANFCINVTASGATVSYLGQTDTTEENSYRALVCCIMRMLADIEKKKSDEKVRLIISYSINCADEWQLINKMIIRAVFTAVFGFSWAFSTTRIENVSFVLPVEYFDDFMGMYTLQCHRNFYDGKKSPSLMQYALSLRN